MALLEYSYTIRNNQVSSAAALNSNFNAAKAIINGAVNQEHISRSAALACATLAVTDRVKTNTIDPATKLVIKLPSNDGSDSVRFKDHNGNTVLEVASDGEVTI